MRVHYEYPGAEGESFLLPAERTLGLFRPRDGPPRDLDHMLRDALDHPVGTPALRELVRDRPRVLLLVEDATSPTPVAKILPYLERELRKGGIRDQDTSVLVARGTRRPLTTSELEETIGPSFLARWSVHQHEWRNEATHDRLGTTDDGLPVVVQHLVAEHDAVVGLGCVGVSSLLGFSGGADVLMPGAAGHDAIAWMQWQVVDQGPGAVRGLAENPIRRAAEEAGRVAGLDAILNVAVDGSGNPQAAAFGDPVAAQRRLAATASELATVDVPSMPHVVVTDGGAARHDFSQSLESLVGAAQMTRPGGSVVLVAPSAEGVAGNHPGLLDLASKTLDEIRDALGNGAGRYAVGAALAALVAQTRRRVRVHLVSSGVTAAAAHRLGFEWHGSIQEALSDALLENGEVAQVAALQGTHALLPRVRGGGLLDLEMWGTTVGRSSP